MKNLVLMLALLILSSGCTQAPEGTGGEAGGAPGGPAAAEAICGNGIAEEGETYENCCLDIPCPDFHVCKELEQEGKAVNVCAKLKLEETEDYKRFMGYWEEESQAYMKESSLIDYDYILSKINQMNRTIAKLNSTYDVSIEKKFVKYRYDRREWNVKRAELAEKLLAETDKEKFMAKFQEIIRLDEGELQRLQGFSEAEVDSINSKFGYDIYEKAESLKSSIKEEKEALELAGKEYEIEMEIIDYSPTCYDWEEEECYLEYVKVNIKNVGEVPLDSPTFDFYIMKGSQVLAREVDSYAYDFDEIPVGYEGVYKETYVGNDDKENIQKGTYTLKVDLKSGISTDVVSSATATVNIS